MASIIHGSSAWNSRGLVLTSQNATEEINGRVNVDVKYVAPYTRKFEVDRAFYTDAPPPLWPNIVDRGELLTNNLYFVDRSIEKSNGMLNITARYCGGLRRAGMAGYYLRESIEYGKVGSAYNYGGKLKNVVISAITPSGAYKESTLPNKFLYNERVKIVEYMRVANDSAAKLLNFTRADMAALLNSSAQKVYVPRNNPGNSYSVYLQKGLNLGLSYDEASQYAFKALNEDISASGYITNAPLEVQAADLWVIEGSESLLDRGALSFEADTPIAYTEEIEYITPTVQVVSLTYRMNR